MNFKILTPQQSEQFVEEGYVVVREAFERSVASELLPLAWQELAINPSDRTTWPSKVAVIAKDFQNQSSARLYSSRLQGVLDDLLGQGRYPLGQGTGYMVVNAPDTSGLSWAPPPPGRMWHIDGMHFHHHLHSREQGLIGLFLFTDVQSGGGATVVRSGSHRITAPILARSEPQGLAPDELTTQVDAATAHFPVVEVTGSAGDVLLMHPHLLHASSPNCREQVRVASNICISLHEPMNFSRADSEHYSLVERAVREAISSVH